LNPQKVAEAEHLGKHRAFTSFANADFRTYFFAATAAMMTDNIEHVISYWVLFQRFHSPALGGFAVISHWVPYLFLAGFSGGLAWGILVNALIYAPLFVWLIDAPYGPDAPGLRAQTSTRWR
jgi:hypothetical protein